MAESINHPDDNKISLLKNRVKILQDICDKIDPFQGISKEDRTILAQMGDFDYSNPYQLTNQLIVMMEDTLEELKRPHDA